MAAFASPTTVVRAWCCSSTRATTRRSYRDDAEELAQLDATIVGISSQSLESHESFAAKHGLTVPLLADHALGLDFQDAEELRDALASLPRAS
jgi:peroxiredoxin